MISRQIVFSTPSAVRKMRVDRQLDKLVRIAFLRDRTLRFAAARNDSDADAACPLRARECAAHRSHHTAASSGEQVHAQGGQQLADGTGEILMLVEA